MRAGQAESHAIRSELIDELLDGQDPMTAMRQDGLLGALKQAARLGGTLRFGLRSAHPKAELYRVPEILTHGLPVIDVFSTG